jgi:SAM-dependent methyltransferase
VADAQFEVRRLAELYDPLEGDRRDLDAYLALADEMGARSALDVGCGTGTLACRLAGRGLEVTGVDPAGASLAVARTKPFADRVHWHCGDATTRPARRVDLVTMTGNVAQVFLDDGEWAATLDAVGAALEPGGLLAFEVRDPARRGWRQWTRAQTFRQLDLPGVGHVETWVALTDVRLPLVSFRTTFVFAADGATCHSDSTLCFREPTAIDEALQTAGFVVTEVRDAPDRPGRELVFLATRT